MGKGKFGGYKNEAQMKAVHASRADGGEGAPSKMVGQLMQNAMMGGNANLAMSNMPPQPSNVMGVAQPVFDPSSLAAANNIYGNGQMRQNAVNAPNVFPTPLNQYEPEMGKRGRIHSTFIGNMAGDGGLVSDENAIVYDTDIKINDPKNILTRPRTRKEFKKGYKYKKEKDGSITLKGRRKVSTRTKNGNHAWVGVNSKQHLQERYQ